MEKLRGLVEKFGEKRASAGDASSSSSINAERMDAVLQQLPITKAWRDSTPRTAVNRLHAINNEKAEYAYKLVRRVDASITEHESSADDLLAQIKELGALQESASAAGRLALLLQNQLVELSGMVSQREAEAHAEAMRELQRREDEKFQRYVAMRRAQLEEKRRGYEEQLAQFTRERISILAAEGTEGAGRRRIEEKVKQKLEQLSLEEGPTRDLETFYGGDGEGEAAQEEGEGEAKDESKTKDESKSKSRGKGKGKSKGKSKYKGKAVAGEPASKPSAVAGKSKPRADIVMDEDLDEADMEDIWSKERKRQ